MFIGQGEEEVWSISYRSKSIQTSSQVKPSSRLSTFANSTITLNLKFLDRFARITFKMCSIRKITSLSKTYSHPIKIPIKFSMLLNFWCVMDWKELLLLCLHANSILKTIKLHIKKRRRNLALQRTSLLRTSKDINRLSVSLMIRSLIDINYTHLCYEKVEHSMIKVILKMTKKSLNSHLFSIHPYFFHSKM